MLDLRRSAVSSHRARFALLALMSILCLMAVAPRAHAATGQVSAFGTTSGAPAADDQYWGPGAVAWDGDDLFIADLDGGANAHLRKVTKTGTQLGVASPALSDPSGNPMRVVGLAVDETRDRLYALVDADVHGVGTAREILVFATTPGSTCPTQTTCALEAPAAPASLTDGVLIDFRSVTSAAVEFASGIAVDPGTGKVAVIGVDDATAGDPTGIIQYILPDGTPSTRVSGLGAGLEPNGSTVYNPSGLAIAANGDVYVLTGSPHSATGLPYNGPWDAASIFRLPRETATPTLVVTDTSSPLAHPGLYDFGGATIGKGSSIAVAGDGSVVYVAEGDSVNATIRGYSSSGAQSVVYGGGTTSCSIGAGNGTGLGLAASATGTLATATTDLNVSETRPLIHVFGEGGTGCPRTAGAFKVGGDDSEPIEVTKGQAVTLDASGSDLLGGAPTKVSWDFGSGVFDTDLTGSPAPLTTTHKFLTPGTFQVGVKIEVNGGPPTDAVHHTVKVVAPKPTASFKVSNRTPAAGGAVSFDAGDSVDPAGSPSGGPSNALKEYRWDFGDGSPAQTTSAATVAHTFTNGGTAALARTVKLTVLSNDDVLSNAVQQTVTVAGVAVTPPDNTPKQETPKQEPPKQGPPVVAPKPSLTAQSVDAKGALGLKVACPAGGLPCAGQVALTTKVKQKVKGKTKTVTVKLGTVTFSVPAGQSKDIKLKLSAAGKALLKKAKKLSATAAISVTAGGKTSTTSKTLTLKAPARRK